MRKIILASKSPRRRELLEKIDLDFEVMVSDSDEVTDKTEPDQVVMDLAGQKARNVFEQTDKSAIVIGADTIVYCNGKILGKPDSAEECKEMLRAISDNTHQVYTGVSLIYMDGDRPVRKSWATKTDVVVYPISEDEMDEYIESDDPFDKAGGYGIQGTFAKFICGIVGDYNNVVGLPVASLYQVIKEIK